MANTLLKLLFLSLLLLQPFYPAAAPAAYAAGQTKSEVKATLSALVARVRDEAAQNTVPVVVFDLDDTTFDSRYKRLLIIGDFIRQPETAAAYPVETAKITPALGNVRVIKASMRETMAALGVSNTAFIAAVSKFSNARIMTNEYLARETAVAGAPAYCNALYKSGARIVYITARRGMHRPGTESALRSNKLPFDTPGVAIYFNERDENVIAYKKRVLSETSQSGKVIGGFENEPDNINLFSEMFPQGYMFFLNTRKSSNTPLKPGITVINNFLN
ncbi:MAG: hypothetical protein PHW69_05375 [Elusimicrobiaceae bacterium]|nr:hypothetical protein [Elusimicrobiaceae bacterium]